MMKQKEVLRGKSIEELEGLCETLTPDINLDFDDVFEVLIEKYGESIDDKKRKQLDIELFVSRIRTGNTTNDRFPYLKHEEVKAHFDKTVINYLKKRIEETANPILKAKYCDVVYELNKGEFEIGKLAIISYLESAEYFFTDESDLEYVDAIERALSLSIFRKDENLIKKSYNAHLQHIEILRNQSRNLALEFIINSLIQREKKLEKYNLDFDLFETIIEEMIRKRNVPSQGTYNSHRNLLKLLSLFPNIKRDKNKLHVINNRIADAFEYEGDHVGKVRSKFVASIFYEDALRVHVSIGSDRVKVEELRKKIRKTNKEAKPEFGVMKQTFTIPPVVINAILRKYENKTMDEFLATLSSDSDIIEEYELVKGAVEITGLQAFTKDLVLKENIKIKDSSTIEEKTENEAVMKMIYHIELMSKTVLDQIFTLLKTSYPAYSEGLLKKISSSNLVNEDRKKLIEHGINLYSKNDYVSSMHILSFQIEGILRDTLYTIDGEDFIYRNNTMREFALGATITKLIDKEIFDVDLLKFIELNMCHLQGKNIRNNIAHGNTNLSLFTRYNNQILLFILLKIAGQNITPHQSTN